MKQFIICRSNGFYIWFPSILNSLANSDASNQDKTICDVLGADKGESLNNTMVCVIFASIRQIKLDNLDTILLIKG